MGARLKDDEITEGDEEGVSRSEEVDRELSDGDLIAAPAA